MERTFIDFLKKSEPIGVLASLSLVISTFTFEVKEFYLIYNYSVTSSFMLFISFIFSIIYQWYQSSMLGKYPQTNIVYELLKFGTYFFLGLGIMLMFLVMIEFRKLQSQIFTILGSFISLFMGYLVFITFVRKLVGKLTKKNTEKLSLMNYISYIVIGSFSSIAVAQIIEALFDLTGITKFLLSIHLHILGPSAIVIFIIYIIRETIRYAKRERFILKNKATDAQDLKEVPKSTQKRPNIYKIVLAIYIIIIIFFSSILGFFFLSSDFQQEILHFKPLVITHKNSSNTNEMKSQNADEIPNENITTPRSRILDRFI